ncbi:MAG: hypothetical protein QOE14_220, partial [Humisphaera sp.]|nr:hypothetical protein [Humisphaera sp.]
VLASGDRPPPSMAAWTITQVPGSVKIYARLIPDGVYGSMRADLPTPTTRPLAKRVIVIEKPTPDSAKVGLDADILAAASGDLLFVQRSPTAALRSPNYRKAERAQVFIQRADEPKLDVPRYVELEFTSPREDLAGGKSAELRVTWELRQNAKAWTDESVAAILTNDTPEPANLMPPIGVP